MKTGTLLRRWSAALIAVLLMISLFAIPAFAEGETDPMETTAETTGETTDETTAETDGETEGETEKETEKETEAETGDEKDEKKGLSTGAIVGIVIGAVIVIAGVILCVKFREKLAKAFRVYKSECKKIVWLSWDQTKKNTLIVIVVLVIFAAVIIVLDYLLQGAFLGFFKLFK